MKKFLIIFFLLALSDVYAQREKIYQIGCSYYGEDFNAIESSPPAPSDTSHLIIQNIVNIIGLKPNFDVRKANVPNAAAVIYKGKRLILYNSDFFKKLNKAAGSKWAGVSILAHEVGHHLNGHTLTDLGSRPDIELEADEFSGFVLRKMGASLHEAQVAMRIASSVKASHTHPAKADRLTAIANGWNTADAQMAGRTIPPKTDNKATIPVTEKSPAVEMESVLDEKYIAYDVKFYADPKGKYYVTIRNNLVKIQKSELFVAAKMAKSNKKNYTAMFYDEEFNYLYIDKKLQIFNGSGNQVGEMKKHQVEYSNFNR